MNLMIQFKAPQLKHEHLIRCLRDLKQQHAFLRMKIVNQNGVYMMCEQNRSEQAKLYLEFYEMSSMEELENWRLRFNQFGSKSRDREKTVIYYELYSYQNDHQLFIGLNHTGIDYLINKICVT